MFPSTFEYFYRNVREAERAPLRNFRQTHPYKQVSSGGVTWHYLACGQGENTFLLLPGGLRVPDAAYQLIEALEKDFKIIAPAYPPVTSASALVGGLTAILEKEQVAQAFVFGASYGGGMAQLFLLKHPDKVAKIILANTGILTTPKEVKLLRLLLPILRRLPGRVLRLFLKRALINLVLKSVNAEQAVFWRAFFDELFSYRLEKADCLSHFEVALDAGERWQIRPEDFKVKPGQMLIIESDRDVIKPEEQAALKALFPLAQVYTFTQTGHTPWITSPQEYLRVIREFLAGTTSLSTPDYVLF